MGEFEEDWDDIDFGKWERQEQEHALSPVGIAEQNRALLRRYREFRSAADAIVATWRDRPEVAAVARPDPGWDRPDQQCPFLIKPAAQVTR